MKKKKSDQQRHSILVCMGEDESLPVLRSVLSGQHTEAEICRDVSELCGKITDQTEAALVIGDLLSEKAIPDIAETLDAQPEWSDLPIILAVTGGADSPVALEAVRRLGIVLLLSYPFTPASLQHIFHAALRIRERQRFAQVLTKECERKRQALLESRTQLEQQARDRTRESDERSAQLRRLIGELILTEQRERHRLAKILHDHLQQLLVSAKFRVASLLRVEDPVVKTTVREIEELLGEVIEASRSLTTELSPPIVKEAGLRTAMEWLVSFMAAQNGLAVKLIMDEEIVQIDENSKVLLFESIRELLLNTVAHAQVRSAEVSIRKADRDRLEIVIVDKGVGFNPESLRHSGFGLIRIREWLELIGGRFEIQSSPGKGSRFRITVPLGESTSQAPPAPAATDSHLETESMVSRTEKPISSTIRILIADDHAVMRQGLSTSLGQEPDMVIVGEALDGKMALEKTRKLKPDVVLMDLGMPGINGIEATQQIHSQMPKVRVIGLSMFEEKERARAMFEAGAVAYLSKSCSVEALTAEIRRCMGKSPLRSL